MKHFKIYFIKKILMSILLVSLFACSEQEAVDKLKKANPKDFSFSLLSVSAKEVSIEKIKSILKNPSGWTIKTLKIDDPSFAEVTGTGVKDLKITIKKGGTFTINITLQKTGYEDFVLKGIKIKVTLKANAKDFSFTILPVNAKEVTIEQIKRNIKAPAGWTIKSIKIDNTTFAEVTGTKITINRGGTFTINITLQKTGYEDFVLKGTIKAANFKADAKDFSFTILPVNAKEVTIEQIKKNLKAPAGWTIKSIKIDDKSYADVDSQLKITIKKSGTFTINITLQKTGYDDYVLKGTILAANFKANAKDFSFTILPVRAIFNKAEVPIEQIKKNLKAPAGWSIKSIKIDDTTFAEVTGTSVKDLKITIKRGGTFTINITLQKTGYEDFVLKGTIKAANFKASTSDFYFLILRVNAKEVTIEQIKKNLKAPAGWSIKSIKIDYWDRSYADVDSRFKITIKRGGTFTINITLQKAGYEDFVLKGKILAASLKADAKDFSFTILPVSTKEVTIEQIKRNIKAPAGWSIKTVKIDGKTYAGITGNKIAINRSAVHLQ